MCSKSECAYVFKNRHILLLYRYEADFALATHSQTLLRSLLKVIPKLDSTKTSQNTVLTYTHLTIHDSEQ